jgi:hypothetical protein
LLQFQQEICFLLYVCTLVAFVPVSFFSQTMSIVENILWSALHFDKVNVIEYGRGNHKWTIQRNWQHRVHKTLIKLTRKSYLLLNMDIQCFKLHKKLEKNWDYLKRRREKTIIRMHKISIQRNWQHRVHKTKKNKHNTIYVLDATISKT